MPPKDTDSYRRPDRGTLTLDDRLDRIEDKVDLAVERLSKGNETFATMSVRIDHLERLVYGLLAIVAVEVIAGLVALVIYVAKAAGHA